MPIAEAFALKVGETALTAALQAATAYLEQARATTEHHGAVTMQYLGAASIAIRGLEQEFQSILVEADNCDWNSPSERQMLRKRIATFMFVDRLRPVLWEAISGIKAGNASLHADAEQFWKLHPKHGERSNAISLLDQTVKELEKYLANLEHLPIGSGPPGTQYLFHLHGLIPRPYESPPADAVRVDIRKTIEDALGSGRPEMQKHTESIASIVRKLDQAFE